MNKSNNFEREKALLEQQVEF